jgi:hypothetical protein
MRAHASSRALMVGAHIVICALAHLAGSASVNATVWQPARHIP